MIIFKISGGLGNQFFQYAFGKFLSEQLNEDLYLDFTSFENDGSRTPKLDFFCTYYKKAPEQKIAKYTSTYASLHPWLKKWYRKDCLISLKDFFSDKHEPGFRKNLLTAKIGYFDGYWGNYKYHISIKELLKTELTLVEQYRTEGFEILKEDILSRKCTVAMHVRRGDYVSNKKFAGIFNTLPKDYYMKALNDISERVGDFHLYVFSDDPRWVKENIKLRITHTIIDDHVEGKDYLEFELMKSCDHFIVANSTFSWWAAYLGNFNDKIVIAPKDWYSNPMYQKRFKKKSFIPHNWILQ